MASDQRNSIAFGVSRNFFKTALYKVSRNYVNIELIHLFYTSPLNLVIFAPMLKKILV